MLTPSTPGLIPACKPCRTRNSVCRVIASMNVHSKLMLRMRLRRLAELTIIRGGAFITSFLPRRLTRSSASSRTVRHVARITKGKDHLTAMSSTSVSLYCLCRMRKTRWLLSNCRRSYIHSRSSIGRSRKRNGCSDMIGRLESNFFGEVLLKAGQPLKTVMVKCEQIFRGS